MMGTSYCVVQNILMKIIPNIFAPKYTSSAEQLQKSGGVQSHSLSSNGFRRLYHSRKLSYWEISQVQVVEFTFEWEEKITKSTGQGFSRLVFTLIEY